jgi:hypothetical protein
LHVSNENIASLPSQSPRSDDPEGPTRGS